MVHTDLPVEEEVETLILKCERGAPAAIRRRLDSLLDGLSLPRMEAYEVKVAVGEAIGNAVRHGCKFCSEKFITVRIIHMPDALVFEISDDGPGFCPDEVPCGPHNFASGGGMGVALMRNLMDKVEFEFEGGTTVRLTKKLRHKLET